MLCLTLNGATMQENYTTVAQNATYASLLELRIDCLDLENPTELEEATLFPSRTSLPVILTCRRKTDSGNFPFSERKRLSLLKKVSAGAFTYVDLEANVRNPNLEAQLRAQGKQLIRSIHDFDGLKDNYAVKITHILAKGDLPKLAVQINTVAQLTELFQLGERFKGKGKVIIIGMGRYGIASRVLYKKLGSILTFCAAKDPKEVGLISIKTMKELYRADQVTDATRIYGVIGDPVGKSLSPAIQNSGFKAIDEDAIYVPFNVDSVKQFFVLSKLLNIQGFSVTVPHKLHVLPYLGKTSREVRQLGSCNTVCKKGDLYSGSNTDYYGFLALIKEPLEAGKINNALVLGSGGGARAIVWALRNHNVNITILNRTLEHAKTLAQEVSCNYGALSEVSNYSGKVDLIVQASSLGMDSSQEPENDPARDFSYTGKEIACDLVYRPQETAFLVHAKQAGCQLIHGLDLLFEQGKLQFTAFTGVPYPFSASCIFYPFLT